MTSSTRYLVPEAVDAVFNRMVAALARLGISLMGSRILAVRGRKSGKWRTTPVNLMTIDACGISSRRGPRPVGATSGWPGVASCGSAAAWSPSP